MVVIRHTFLTILCHLILLTPVETPNKIEILQQRFNVLTAKDRFDDEELAAMQWIEFNIGLQWNRKVFEIRSRQQVRCFDKAIRGQKFKEIEMKYGPCLLPKVQECCGKFIKLYSKKRTETKETLYELGGTKNVIMYLGSCQSNTCSRRFSYSYEEETLENNIVIRKFYKIDKNEKVFAMNRVSAFSIQFLEHVTKSITFNGADFGNTAKVYNKVSDLVATTELGRNSLEDAFLCYKITLTLPELPLVLHRMGGGHIDVEKLCYQAAPLMRKVTIDGYLKHECTRDKGCQLKVVIGDGNQKCRRRLCHAPKETIEEGSAMPNYYSLCTASPKIGSKSIYCENHQYLEKGETKKKVATSSQVDIRPITRLYAKELLRKDLIEKHDIEKSIGCRDKKNITRYYDTTAGIFSFVRPCKMKLGTYEQFTSESESQTFIYLVDKFGIVPSPEEIKVFAYDLGCGFDRFVEKRKDQNQCFKYYSMLTYIVDKFHANGHKEECCQPGPKGKYHPDLPCFEYLKGTDLESCENSFRFMNKHKATTNLMTQGRRLVYIMTIEDEFNNDLENDMKLKGELTMSGSEQGWRNEKFDHKTLYFKFKKTQLEFAVF